MGMPGMPTSPRRRGRDSRGGWDAEVDMDVETARILDACKSEIMTLWRHPWLPDLLKKRRFQLEESSGFFMSQLDRIAQLGYIPDYNDILRARLRTMGIVEHIFRVQIPPHNRYLNWKLYDVGGSRGQRASWVPYFEDARAIIYLAPISSFDQYLEEDSRCNRVEDSLQLFRYICGHPLLQKVHLVLFLNKIDVLRHKLESGIRYADSITSYGDRANDAQTVCAYFRSHFQQIHKKSTKEENGEQARALYCHYTTVIDIVATRKIIGDVRDAITRTHLKDSVIL
jgi:guanine nucleotide-binding protein subunit alpha